MSNQRLASRTQRRGGVLLLAAIAIAGSTSPSCAFEGMLTHYLRGSADFYAGFVPTEPGVHVQTKYAFYAGEADEHSIPENLDIGVDLDLNVWINAAAVITPWEILGGTYGFAGTLSYAWIVTDADIRRYSDGREIANQHGYVQGFTDPTVTPLILGWHDGNWHWNTTLSVFVPGGRYQRGEPSTGKKFWSIVPSAAVTYIDPASGWHGSLAMVYSFPFENEEVKYKSGQVIEFDYAVGKQVTRSLSLGLAGYAVQQTTPDKGIAAAYGNFQARVFSVGPIARLSFDLFGKEFTAKAKWAHEFGGKNTFVGDQIDVTLATAF